MKRIISTAVLAGCVVVLMWTVGDSGIAYCGNSDRSELNVMIQRMDQCLTRTRLVRDAMSSMPENDRVVAISESAAAIAEQLKVLMQVSQELLERRTIMADPQLEQDVRGIRVQLDYLARALENMLQYVEHMSYRLDQMSRHS